MIALVGLCAVASGAAASVVANSGGVLQITRTGSEDLSNGGPFQTSASSGYEAYVFDEDQNLFASNLQVDLQPVDAVGDWSPGDPTTPVQLSGLVSSHYLHFDTDGTVSLSGFVEFNGPILGLMVETATLDASDSAVGSGGLTFEPGRTLGVGDTLRVEASDRRLVFNFENLGGVDQVRVITGAAVVSGPVKKIIASSGDEFVADGLFEGDSQGLNTIYSFPEKVGVTVANLAVDLDASALKSGWAIPDSTSPSTVTATVDSHYLFFDSVDDTQTTRIVADLVYPTQVLGVVFSDANLVASDALLAIDGVDFSMTRNLGSLGDAIELDVSGHELHVELTGFGATDDIRVITRSVQAIPVLGPFGIGALIALLSGAGAGAHFARTRRRS